MKPDSESLGKPEQSSEAETRASGLRLAIVVSHPIQYFAPWHRQVAALPGVTLKVFFCKERGATSYLDQEFGIEVKWDIPLLDGYDHEFLPGTSEEKGHGFLAIDNPTVGEALTQFQPDVLLLHGYALRTCWRASAWCKRHDVPVMLLSDSNSSAARAGWKRLLKAAVVNHFYRGISGAFVTGNNNRAYHRQYGVPDERLFAGTMPVDVVTLRSWVPDPQEARRELRASLQIPEDAFVIVFSGKLVENKCPEHLLQAVHRSSLGGRNVWALFVGEGARRMLLEKLIAESQMSNARLVGFVNQTSIGRYYAVADAIALMSRREAKGLVVPEAGAFGLPAILSDSVGCIGPTDSARLGENALSYPWGDIDALTDRINMLYDDRDLRSRMSERSKEIAEEQDAQVAARLLVKAAIELKGMGRRR